MTEGAKQEIGAKLVLEDGVSKAAEHIKEGFGEVGHKIAEVKGELVGLAKQSLGVAIGFQFDHGIESMKEFAHEVIGAAEGAQKQQKELAGILAISDRTGATYEELRTISVDLHGELENLGIASGVATDQVIDGFGLIAERSKKTREEIFELTGMMTNASKALPGGMAQLAGAFRDLESGIIRPRNAIVQLMRQTGTVGGTAKQISKGLSAMMQSGDEKQIEKVFALAEKAIGKMNDKLKNSPPTFDMVVQSLKDIRENMYEAMGVPILNAVTPQLTRLKGFFIENREAIEHWATMAGTKVGEWVVLAAEKMKKAFEYLSNHADEIKEALTVGAEKLQSVLNFLVEHREAITWGLRARTAVNLAKGAAPALGAFGSVVAGGLNVGGAQLIAGAGASAMATAGALAAFTAAIVAVGAAAYHWSKLMDETRDLDTGARMDALRAIAGKQGDLSKADVDAFSRVRDELVNAAAAAGQNSAAVGAMADAIWNARTAARAAISGVDANYREGNGAAILAAYETAIRTNDKGTEKYIDGLLATSRDLQLAFLTSKDSIEGGWDHLAEGLGDGKKSFEELLKTMFGKKAFPDKIEQNFTGAITIKQDFKNEDPDNIAMVFRRDLARHAVAPTQAMGAGGLLQYGM